VPKEKKEKKEKKPSLYNKFIKEHVPAWNLEHPGRTKEAMAIVSRVSAFAHRISLAELSDLGDSNVARLTRKSQPRKVQTQTQGQKNQDRRR
jgi:hypothetical protein